MELAAVQKDVWSVSSTSSSPEYSDFLFFTIFSEWRSTTTTVILLGSLLLRHKSKTNKQTNSGSPFFTHTSSSQSFFSRLSKSLDRSLMLKFRSSLARWWLKSVPRCPRHLSPGLALRSRSLSVPTGGPLRFPRGRCLFPLVDLCNSLAFASCSRRRTFALPWRSLPVPTGEPLHFPCHRCLLFPLADLWSLFAVPTGGPVLCLCYSLKHATWPTGSLRSHLMLSCSHVHWHNGNGHQDFYFFPVLWYRKIGEFSQKNSKISPIYTRKAIFSNFFPISFVKKNHWMNGICPMPTPTFIIILSPCFRFRCHYPKKKKKKKSLIIFSTLNFFLIFGILQK